MKRYLTTIREAFMFLCTALALLAVPRALGACTTKSNWETLISGYPESHKVNTLVFDMEEATSDIVVGGKLETATFKDVAFLYLAEEHLCKVIWYYHFTELTDGIEVVAFSTSEPGVVYAVGSAHGTMAKLMWVKGGRLFETKLKGHDGWPNRSLHFTPKAG